MRIGWNGTCLNCSHWEDEARGQGVEGQPQVHTELSASAGYMRLCLKNQKCE